jgi:hypothetical protein
MTPVSVSPTYGLKLEALARHGLLSLRVLSLRLLSLRLWVALITATACATSEAPAGPEVSVQPDTTMVPLTDLAASTYRGFQGGLYPSGSNTMPRLTQR